MTVTSGTVFVVSGMLERGRVQRVLHALRAAGFAPTIVSPTRKGAVRWPSIQPEDAIVLHSGGLGHSAVEGGARIARAVGARYMLIHSLNLDRIIDFARGGDPNRERGDNQSPTPDT